MKRKLVKLYKALKKWLIRAYKEVNGACGFDSMVQALA